MLFVTRNFVVDRSYGTLELLRQDGITGPRAWARMLWFAWVRPGMLRKIFGAWLAFFMPGFHPWKHDDRDADRQGRKRARGGEIAGGNSRGLAGAGAPGPPFQYPSNRGGILARALENERNRAGRLQNRQRNRLAIG